MASTPSTRTRFEQQAAGENLNTWGPKEVAALNRLEEAIAGRAAVTVSGSVTLTAANYTTDQARNMILDLTGTGGTVTIPSVEKIYIVRNGTSGSVIITTGSGVTATIPSGDINFVMCDGTNVRAGAQAATAAYLPLTGGNVTGNLNVSGVIGIGTTSPTQKLHVVGAAAATVLIESGNAVSRINFKTSSDANGFINYDTGALKFFKSSGGSPVEFLRLDTDGYAKVFGGLYVQPASKLLAGTLTVPSGAGIVGALIGSGSNDGGLQLGNGAGGGGAIISEAGPGLQFFTYTGAVGSEAYTLRGAMGPTGTLAWVGDITAGSFTGPLTGNVTGNATTATTATNSTQLNSQAASYYTNIIARLGYTPLDAASYTAADILAKLLTVDGSGSGLDADKLDGHDTSYFALASDFSDRNAASTGHFALPGGLYVNWAKVMCTGNSTASVTWDKAFPNACFVAVATSQNTTISINNFAAVISPDQNGCTVARVFGGGNNENNYIHVIAVGN